MKFIRIAFFGLLALLLIASMGIFILFQTFDTDQYLSQITQKASLALGRGVSIGHVGLGLSLKGGITLDVGPVNIMDDLSFTTQPFIKVDKVRVRLDLGSLIFRREIRITGICLQSPQVHFIRSLQGDINVRSIGSGGDPKPAPSVNSSLKDEVIPQGNVELSSTLHPDKVKIESINIQDAAFSFIDQNQIFPLDIWLTGLNADLGELSTSRPFPVKFDASLFSNVPNLRASAMMAFDLSKRSVEISDLELNMDLSKLDIDKLNGVSPQMQNSPILKDITGVVQLNVAELMIDASGVLTANGKIVIKGAVIKDFNIIKLILSHSLGAFAGMEGNINDLLNGQLKDKLGANDTVIESAEAQFSVHDKTVFIDDSLIQTDIFQFTAKGSLDYGMNLDMQTMLRLNDDASASLINKIDGLKFLCDDSKRIAIGASLKGVIPHLKYKPNKDFKKKSRKALIEEGGSILGVLFGGGNQ